MSDSEDGSTSELADASFSCCICGQCFNSKDSLTKHYILAFQKGYDDHLLLRETMRYSELPSDVAVLMSCLASEERRLGLDAPWFDGGQAEQRLLEEGYELVLKDMPDFSGDYTAILQQDPLYSNPLVSSLFLHDRSRSADTGARGVRTLHTRSPPGTPSERPSRAASSAPSFGNSGYGSDDMQDPDPQVCFACVRAFAWWPASAWGLGSLSCCVRVCLYLRVCFH